MKIISVVLVFAGILAFAQNENPNPNNSVLPKKSVSLMDDTNPNNLAACLAKISFYVNSSTLKNSAKSPNFQVKKCVDDSVTFNEKPSNFECRKAATKVRASGNTKQAIYRFCDENYFETLVCVNGSNELKSRLDKAKAAGQEFVQEEGSAPGEKAGKTTLAELEKRLNKKVRDCVLDNAKFFNNDFCIKFIKQVGMLADTELSNVCLNETKKSAEKPAGDSQN